MATRILLGVWAEGLSSLIDEQGLDEKQLRNAVDSALGELKQDEIGKVKGKAKIKAGGEDEDDKFILTERQVNKFAGGASSPLRLFYLNQELVALEKTVGTVELSGWPAYLVNWAKKFQQAQPKPEPEPAQPAQPEKAA